MTGPRIGDMVAEFHRVFYLPASAFPALVDEKEAAFRERLLREEFEEYITAVRAGDLVEIADALADMVYVIYGTALVYGVPLDDVLSEVHRSNMTKMRADEAGKLLKGPGYSRPDIIKALGGSS